ncbi:MAG TPA: DUF4251 domain-containing protein [Chitinophagaceae bacterium]|nr:DUF4251 domain-containing protein [Chitinophagaceae bacterium]
MNTYKKLSLIFFLATIGTCGTNSSFGQDSKNEKKEKEEAEIKNLIDSQNFVFKAQIAYPLGSRSRQLTPEYDLRITKNEVVSDLPYFGRAYSSTPGASGGLDFNSKDFEYTVKEKKDDGWEIHIKPKDTQKARELFLTAFKNGSANLQVSSNDKQNISFSGYITAIKSNK